MRSYAEPGTAKPYDPEGDESLAEYIKKYNLGSFTLGPIQINPLELSNVAATLASGGKWCPPNPIDKVFDRHGKEVPTTVEACEQVVPTGLANTLANALSKDDQPGGTAAGSAGSVGWNLPLSSKTGTTEAHRSSAFLGYTNNLAGASYIYDDSTTPGDLCSFPLRKCGDGNLYGGNEPARAWFEAMKPIADNYGPTVLPPTEPRYVEGGPGSKVPSINGLREPEARDVLKKAGFRVADQASSVNSTAPFNEVVGTSPSGTTIPGSVITILMSNGIPPAPPPLVIPGIPGAPPGEMTTTIVNIPGLPPITVPVLAPPP
ncbi:bifunctional membrane-associated penicillin-binding protein PonA2/glycosyl transferase [Mycobacteroides abscessus subsp. abscessus]|nr:bifunctional membrane-associated penicillin-binding protein PonA2/glycosyl transferase [Mycobacteroides abscessus subsp. abscessus]